MSDKKDDYDYYDDGGTVLEKLVSAVIVLLLLLGLGHVFGWEWIRVDANATQSENTRGDASPFRRDWRTQMAYRYMVPGKNGGRLYLVYETMANPIEVTLPFGVGDHEVDLRTHTCITLEEAEAVIQISPLDSHFEVFEVRREDGTINLRFMWTGVASIFNKNDLFIASETAEASL